MIEIIFDSKQVSLMIGFAMIIDPNFGSKWHLSRMASGSMKPSEAILQKLNLREQEGRYIWAA